MSALDEPFSIESRPALSTLEYSFRRLLRRARLELVIALGLPLLTLLVSVGSLVYFTHRVNHSDQVIARMNHAVALVETMESNLRAYSLTKQKNYLDNCIEARAEVDPTLAGMDKLVSDNLTQEALLSQFHSQADELIARVDETLNHLAGTKAPEVSLRSQMQTSQNLIDEAMESGEKFMDNESDLREARYGWFGKSLVLTAVIFLLLACTVIPVVLYRHRMALKQVSAMYNTSLQALLQSTERFRLFTAVVEMNIWTANPLGELDYANEQSVVFFGNADLLGHSWFQYVHPDDAPRVSRVWQESVQTGAPYEIEMRLRSGTGEYRWFLTRARCTRDAQGKITRWFGATADIDALKKAQQGAMDANRAKDVFLAALSHELRNPLNPALLVASAEAENPELPAPVRSNFSVILNNIELEARLIDDLLDLTRISTGKLSLRKQLVDIHRIFMDALASTQPDQLRKKITLTVEWNAQKNEVNGDPLRLRQIFWNVLKNAVKFTPPDGIVRVNASNADSHVIIKVTDTGIGIKPEELSRLFNPFAQGDHAGKTGSQVYGGLGLGLAIAKNLADMHAGSINAESEGANKGSTFTVELPLAA